MNPYLAYILGVATGIVGTLAFFWFLDKAYELGERDTIKRRK